MSAAVEVSGASNYDHAKQWQNITAYLKRNALVDEGMDFYEQGVVNGMIYPDLAIQAYGLPDRLGDFI